mgnify:FL=1
MPAPSYIPAQDAGFNNWLLNFSSLLTAAPTTYGLTAPDAIIVAASVALWSPAYAAAINPATRTAPTVAQKDAQRAATEATVRPYAQRISRNAAVDPLDKVAIGVNLPNSTPVPIPVPTTFPQLSFDMATPLRHVLRYQDSGLGTGKAKPFGAIALEVWRAVGTAPAVDPSACTYYGNFTKAPLAVDFDAGQVGKIATYFARWVTRSGSGGKAFTGPWSPALTASIM